MIKLVQPIDGIINVFLPIYFACSLSIFQINQPINPIAAIGMSDNSSCFSACVEELVKANSNPSSDHPSIFLASRSKSSDCKIEQEQHCCYYPKNTSAADAAADSEAAMAEQDMPALLIDIPPPHLTVNQYFMLLDTVQIAQIEASAGCSSAANCFVRDGDAGINVEPKKEIYGAEKDTYHPKVQESNDNANVVPFTGDQFIDQGDAFASTSAATANTATETGTSDQFGGAEFVGNILHQQQQEEEFGSDGEDTISGSETGHGADSDSTCTLSSHFSSAGEDVSNDADDCSLGCSLAETNGSVDILLESGSVEFYSDNDNDEIGVYEEHGVYEDEDEEEGYEGNEIHTEDQQSCDEVVAESAKESVNEISELTGLIELFTNEETCTKLYTTMESSDADTVDPDGKLDLQSIAKIGFEIEVADVRDCMVMLIVSALSPAKNTNLDNCTDTCSGSTTSSCNTLAEVLDDASVQLRLFDEGSESAVVLADEMQLIAEVQQAVDQQLKAEIFLLQKKFYTVDEVLQLCSPVMGFLVKAFGGGRGGGGLGVGASWRSSKDASAQIGLSFVARALRFEMSTGTSHSKSTVAASTTSNDCNATGESFITDIRREKTRE